MFDSGVPGDGQFSSGSRRGMSYLPPIRDSDVIDGLNIWYLKIFGLWRVINDYRTTGKKNWLIKTMMIVTFLLAIPYAFCQCLSYFMIEIDIKKATLMNMHALPGLQIFSMILTFWFRMGDQCRLFNLVRKDFLPSVPESKRLEIKEICNKITAKCNITCMAACVVNLSIAVVMIGDPEISIDYLDHHTGSMAAVTGGMKKVSCVWYPLPMSESPYYEVIFVYESIFIIVGGIFLASYVCLFYVVLMCLYAQFAVFGYHVSTLKLDTEVQQSHRKSIIADEIIDSKIYNELYAILHDHRKLLSYANELRSVYNPFITMLLGVGVVFMIITVFQFLFGETGSYIFIFRSLQFLVYQGIEVFMFCFGSSYVEEASSDLQFAIYSSDWYKVDTKFRKAAQMMMVRARKGETLTAMKMYPINRETIMAILQFTYSVATLMSRMTE